MANKQQISGYVHPVSRGAAAKKRRSLRMPNKDDEKPEFIPVDEEIAEWRKDPGYMREYERQKPEFDRECAVHAARQKRRKAVLAWVRGVGVRVRGIGAKLRGAWAYLTGGIDRRVL